jgi:hypothetical protein
MSSKRNTRLPKSKGTETASVCTPSECQKFRLDAIIHSHLGGNRK